MKSECKSHVEKLVNEYKDKHNAYIVNNTNKIMKLVKNYIKEYQLILYGGYALNELLPKNKKIYNDETKIKDFDCYCVNSIIHGKNLVNLLINEGYKYVVMKRGFSKDTIKVFVEFVSVCDFTEISYDKFEYYKKISVIKNGVHIASPIMIKASMSMELSQPHLSYYRWEKIMPRFKLICNEFKDKNVKISKFTIEDNIELYKELLSTIKQNNIPLAGIVGYKLHNNEDIFPLYIYGNKMATLSVICKSESLYLFEKVFKKMKNSKISKISNSDTISYIDDKGNFILDIYIADNRCITICNKQGYKVVSIIGILHLLYNDFIIYYNNDKKDIERLLFLGTKLLQSMKCTDKCYMGLECYGNFYSIFKLHKEKWDDIGIKYKPYRQKKNKSIFT